VHSEIKVGESLCVTEGSRLEKACV